MATDQTSEYDLLQLKVAIEHQSFVLDTVLRTVQDVQHMSMKTDKRVGLLETDVKQILSKRSTCPKCQDSQPVTTAEMSNSNNNSTKEEIMEMTRAEMTELKSVVKEEVSRHGNVYIQHQDELLSRLDKVDQVVLPQLSEMSEEIKTTAAHLETLEKGTRALENSMNEYTTKLNYLQENLMPKAEMTNKLQTLTEAANQQTDCNDQLYKEEVTSKVTKLTDTVETLSTTVDTIKSELVPKAEMTNKLQSLTEAANEQRKCNDQFMLKEELDSKLSELSSTVDTILSELEPQGGMEEMVRKHSRTLIDQLIAEGQLIREVVQQSRNVRKYYTCDFHVEDFKDCIGSGERQHSKLWFIDQLKTHVKGWVCFNKDKTLQVWLVFGCYPRLFGLQPTRGGPVVSVTVTALRQPGRSGDNKKLGSEENCDMSETGIPVHCDGWESSWGHHIATVTCEDLNTEDFVQNGKLFLRYKISIL